MVILIAKKYDNLERVRFNEYIANEAFLYNFFTSYFETYDITAWETNNYNKHIVQ